MRIVTLNVNGVRSAASKGLFDWLESQSADVVCLQETKAQEHQLADACFRPLGHHCFYFDAQRPGYSGTALYARRAPDEVVRGFGVPEFDREGRYLEARFGSLSVVSLYLPSGSAGPERQASKLRCLEAFQAYLRKLSTSRRHYILCGDWNIAHKPIDLRNWRSNQKNSGFLPEERAWLDTLFADVGYVDSFRRGQWRARSVHVVVKPWTGLGKERGLADRLSDKQPGLARRRRARGHLQGATFLRSRPADHGLRHLSPKAPAPATRSWLQAMLVYRQRPVLSMLFLGFSAGLPFYLVFQTLSAWLRQEGIERSTIGMLAWVGLFYTIKFLWAPIVDRVPLPILQRLLGRRRSWMLLAQLGIATALFNLSQSEPSAGRDLDRLVGDVPRVLCGHSGHRARRLAH